MESQVLKYLYTTTDKSLRDFIISNNGDHTIADDILQDAIIVWYEKVKNQEFKLQTTISGYIYTVGKYIWYNRQRKNKKIIPSEFVNISEDEENFTEQDFELFQIDKTNLVEELLEQIGISCKKVLIESIYMKIPMQEIAVINELKNEQVARNKKSKCLKKLRKIIEASSYFKNALKHLRT
ncbi:sigma-70 family RNA polymerase sigma factor [uncultured Kordia sp.]|uniref:RNA polymerase sigma factor n=1 Tax=uncultured Kordia sp. TaxID=507699 RepID=UPI00260A8EEA|nr:sigma-70 family RNA polymerase sigma factor [uncultured Kordia sp.]